MRFQSNKLLLVNEWGNGYRWCFLKSDSEVIKHRRVALATFLTLLQISSPNFDIFLSVDLRLNNQLSCARVAYVPLETGLLISRQPINIFSSVVHLNQPWNFSFQSESEWRAFRICPSFWKIHYFVIFRYCTSVCFLFFFILFSWCIWCLFKNTKPSCRELFPAGSSLSLFDWQIHNNLTKTMLFTGLAAKIHCQSGLAQSTAGFYPTSAETSHIEHLPEVTVPCYSQRNLGKKKRCWKRSACRPPRSWAAGIIGINNKMCNRKLTRLLTAGHKWRLNRLLSC